MNTENTTDPSAPTGTADDSEPPLLRASDLVIEYTTRHGRVRSLDAATLTVQPGEITALVGESGSGKTTLGMATGRLLASNARHIGGRLHIDQTSVFDCTSTQLRELRRQKLAYIFQNPVAALDPTMRINRQIRLATPDVPEKTAGRPGPEDSAESIEQTLRDVGLDDVPRVLRSYPHQLSGGMAQRVTIAIALRRRPRLLIADEPTAAVDATLRAQILRLLVDRCRQQRCALLLLTHDLHAVATHTENIAVMYGGRIVEAGATARVLADPRHPYTQALISALPGEEEPGQRLHAIRGVPPALHGAYPGCAFAPRCPQALAHCDDTRPAHTRTAGRDLLCHLHTSPGDPDIPGDIDDSEDAAADRARTREATT